MSRRGIDENAPYGPGNPDYEYDAWRDRRDEEMLLKLCKDCANFIPNGEGCSKSPMPPDYVAGKETGFFLAQSERESFTGCGPQGKFFTPIQKAAA